MKSENILSLVLSAMTIATCVAACSKDEPDTTIDAGSSSSSSSGSTGDDDDVGPSNPILTPVGDDDDGGTPTSDAGSNCTATTTQNACAQCCGAQHQAGFKAYNAAVTKCVCTTTCNFECSPNLCANQTATADCTQCANDRSQSCSASVSAACKPNADCVAYANCLTSSSCSSKSTTH